MQAKKDGVENPKFGFIGPFASATITKFEIGYIEGFRSVYPNAEIVDYYVNSFVDSSAAKTAAKSMYDNGVYCIFAAAGCYQPSKRRENEWKKCLDYRGR